MKNEQATQIFSHTQRFKAPVLTVNFGGGEINTLRAKLGPFSSDLGSESILCRLAISRLKDKGLIEMRNVIIHQK
jgi:hypothetical protein